MVFAQLPIQENLFIFTSAAGARKFLRRLFFRKCAIIKEMNRLSAYEQAHYFTVAKIDGRIVGKIKRAAIMQDENLTEILNFRIRTKKIIDPHGTVLFDGPREFDVVSRGPVPGAEFVETSALVRISGKLIQGTTADKINGHGVHRIYLIADKIRQIIPAQYRPKK